MTKLDFIDQDQIWKFYVQAAKLRKFSKFVKATALLILDKKYFSSIS